MDDAPVLRHKPQRREIGKVYANVDEWQADVDAWEKEHMAHKEKMAGRKKLRQKGRDRSARTRPDGDSDRRVQQRRQKNTRQESFMMPTPQAFFTLAMLHRVGTADGHTPGDFDAAVAEWSRQLGRKAWAPSAKDTYLHTFRSLHLKEQRAHLLDAVGVRVADADLSADSLYIGEERDGRLHGKGARMDLRVDWTTGELRVSCYDGQWQTNKFTGRGAVKHHNGDYEDGLFCAGHLYVGFRVTQRGLESVRSTPQDVHPEFRFYRSHSSSLSDARIIEGLDGTVATKFHDGLLAEGCARLSAMDDDEFDSLSTWAEEEGRLDHAKYPTAGFGDDIIEEWHESESYQNEYLADN